jgi:DNA modification methylase
MSDQIPSIGDGAIHERPPRGPLRQRFLFPPFSVLNARDGEWRERKRWWNSLGIESECGRDVEVYEQSQFDALNIRTGRQPSRHGGRTKTNAGTSVFDPVLAEVCYRWWCPAGGIVLDPFAGGSVRGIVASILGRNYWGCELRPEQVEANKHQLTEDTCGRFKPRWVCGDSADEVSNAPAADFVLSCPPYGNLEKYSDDPRDISTMKYDEFLVRYRSIVASTCERLREDRFTVFVVANFRDKSTGVLCDLVGDTVNAFEDAGTKFYNDIVLVTAIGSAAMRTNTNFARGARKVVKTHQNVLVFVKGDPKKADAWIASTDKIKRERQQTDKLS